MALRTIRVQGDPILNKVCRPITEVTPKIRTLAEDMIETMYEANGVGLAAPQVGILKRIVVIDVGDGQGPYVMINPEILESSGEQTGDEGCLSVPGKSGGFQRIRKWQRYPVKVLLRRRKRPETPLSTRKSVDTGWALPFLSSHPK